MMANATSTAKQCREKTLTKGLSFDYNSESQPKLAAWAEENLPEGFAVFAFPEAHRKRLRTSNACENFNGQIKKRTRVVGLFPSEESLLRLVTGVLIEISETWETGKTYLSSN